MTLPLNKKGKGKQTEARKILFWTLMASSLLQIMVQWQDSDSAIPKVYL